MSERLCLTDDRMVPCPVAGLENTILGLRHELMHTWTRTEGQRVRLIRQREALKAAVRRTDAAGQACVWVGAEMLRDMEERRAAEAKLHGMVAALRQWRTLAGQMTDERDTVIAEVTKERALNDGLVAQYKAAIEEGQDTWDRAIRAERQREALKRAVARVYWRERTQRIDNDKVFSNLIRAFQELLGGDQ